MKFKVGDIIVGNERANRYGITKQGWRGVVKDSQQDCIRVSEEGIPNGPDFTLDPDCFDLVGPANETNAEKFARMSVDELVDFFTSAKVSSGCPIDVKKCSGDCKACWKKWLEAKAT